LSGAGLAGGGDPRGMGGGDVAERAGGGDPRPVLFVTNHAPQFRVGAFRALHERENVVFALIGGDVRHGGGAGTRDDLPFPAIGPSEKAIARLAASGRFRAVVAGLSGKVALPAAYAGARAAKVPFVLWATIWRHPRTPAHALSYLPLTHIYRHADAIATYGPHVTRYVRSKGARQPVIDAPQAVDTHFWGQSADAPTRHAPFQAMFAGRIEREKGASVLLQAWRASGLPARDGALLMCGDGPIRARAAAAGALTPGPLPPDDLRNSYAGSDVVVVPSLPTRDFLEPWGLVVNEAFHQGVPVIATDAVGAAAGGLVEHERTGLIVPAGDAPALAHALRRLHDDPPFRARLAGNAHAAVAPYTQAAWAEAMSRTLREAGC
jgi:glycosyltransferase involved in cell wall biosynthesis